MVDIKTLLPKLRDLVRELAEDLLARSTSDKQIDAGLREAFQQIEKGGRTAQAFEVWREDYLDQVAVAWVLACVFVRFLEDNHLIDECWLAGEGQRRKLAEDTHELFFRAHPHDTDREYFQHVFREVGKIPAARDLFAEGKTPLWAVGISGDAAMSLLKFWREQVEDMDNPPLKRSFEVEDGDTRFLGDLYQELSERAKKKYALLQTPVFVEEFILDRTLTPAIDEFGLDTVRMIDPTCGSGHFLLGGFARLFRLWNKPEHTTGNDRTDVQKALDGVWGVDINPFAVAIARFRLIVAALQACGIRRLKDAPGWKVHLATGDSLLFGSKSGFGGERVAIAQQLTLFEVPAIYAVEDRKTLQEILGQGYHVVVGNPPYITVKDTAHNEAYRRNFPQVCYRQYSLGVPFTQRFWELAIQKGEASASAAGHIGMITANSFMKREFGRNLIEKFFPRVDLTHVVDTSVASIPGHGTPTVILFGRNQSPCGETVRAVLGIKGEPIPPANPANGLVWNSILGHIDRAGAGDEFTSASDIARSTFAHHPWSIGGGGAAELKELIEESRPRVADHVDLIGYICMTRADDIYCTDIASLRRLGVPASHIVVDVEGDSIRDWSIVDPQTALFPYDEKLNPVPDNPSSPVIRFLWPYKTLLWTRREPNGNHRELGLTWHGWSRFQRERYQRRLAITFAEIATHTHFVFDRGGKVFRQTAPIIKLRPGANEDDYLALTGLLNSSTVCFWLKQVAHNKGGPGGACSKDERWHDFYDFSSTKVELVPIVETEATDIVRKLDKLANAYIEVLPHVISTSKNVPTRESLSKARSEAAAIRDTMIALQEELDWYYYFRYGLTPEALTYVDEDLPKVSAGERAFEVAMARDDGVSTKWFELLHITPTADLPRRWPDAYRRLVEKRLDVIANDKNIQLIETPNYKRTWEATPWEELEQRALKNWLLDRLESPRYWRGTEEHPELVTTAHMADVASADADFLEVATLYRGRADFDVWALVAELIESESVPTLPVLRYKPAGLRKRAVWERTWELQRKQDASENIGTIPVPPKYTTADFLKTDCWRLRGKLDVPKERWISYPHCSTESDPTLLVGWAGWNHLEQATAIINYYDARKREGWDAKRLTPLLAGLDQLLPWIHQWHPEIDPEFGETAGQSYQTMLKQDAHELGLTLDDIRGWQPPATTTRRRARKT